MAASVHQRLLNKARATSRPFNELLSYYAMERFLYRISSSEYSDRFVLKGALMFWVWRVADSRATMDIDLLGRIKNDPALIASVFKKVCGLATPDDGLRFDPATVTASRIVEAAPYKGVRVTFRGYLDRARIPMQIDIGFGDPIHPEPPFVDYPTILDHPAPQMKGYRRENSIAEKFEAMCTRGLQNTRLKDYYDIWLLSRRFDFEGSVLSRAIRETFQQRRLEIPASPLALGPAFASDPAKIIQWRALLRRNRLTDAPQNLARIVKALKGFLGPIAESLSSDGSFTGRWSAPGPWKKRR